MLKQLLKYEFKATKRLYFGLYLALALLSVVLGVTFRQEHALAHSTSFQNLEVILMIVYVSVILAIAVLCFVNTIQRFYQNLLGREGYLMHTLPVNENQLILSKLLTSMVWVLCSGLVGIVCITVMVSIGVIDSETFGMVDDIKEYAESLYTDEEFQLRRANYSAHCMPFTKESLFYREIFEKYYHDQSRTIVGFWMPNKAWPGCNVNDPSARVLANYGASGV